MGPYLPSSLPVLLVDDDPNTLKAFQTVLEQNGIGRVLTALNARHAEDILRREEIGAMLLDLRMPEVSGEELLSRTVAEFPEIPVIIVTGSAEIDVAVDCMRRGAFDFIVKPVDPSRLMPSLRRALELRELRNEFTAVAQGLLYGTIQNVDAFASIVTNNPVMLRLLQYAEIIAKTPKPVLITGETGVGKDVLARAIHAASGRAGDFVAVNVGGLEDTTFSDTLFGHVRGAYTGADEVRAGLIERAQHGTLFLDEIGDLAPASQLKLLRLIEEHEYYPLGSDFSKVTDARFICATNQDLEELQKAGRFRKDLYYRLKTHEIALPPLRERLDDLPLLLEYFIQKSAKALGKEPPIVSPQVFEALESYDFPGNVRELEALVYDAVSRHTGEMLSVESFPLHVRAGLRSNRRKLFGRQAEANPLSDWVRLPTLHEMQHLLIHEALRRTRNNRTLAARLLGISRPTLLSHLKDDVQAIS
ncbi:MAG TPA: sigma-54 dependent transcriptional regulator [Candidatus Hydrogenedentes bacterium]|nr:sigma-54 dependent transcriptional regulator [Candidatus Hydrogenedentota bacterium]HOL76800.1 sigma-54 dependent transcriptional regulator [Candidatus Hydrogenedentota bacterium]HPO85723.1 sigma-54 dependent transcriptional regulator [Candidatus Hydrogenedentota bacterium]